MVTVTSEGAPIGVNGNAFPETPAFCRVLAEGGKVNTQICPDEMRVGAIAVSNVIPVSWRVRITFSELLDPDVEDLEDRDMDGLNEGHIDQTLPVSLTCGGADVAYDGFYDPSGNDVTVPPGPALVIETTGFPVVTGSACEVTINDVPKDKDGNGVLAAHRGPHQFTLSPFHFDGLSVEDGDEGVDPDQPLAIFFNAPIDETTLADANLTVTDNTGGGAVAVALALADPQTVLVLPAAGAFPAESEIELTFPDTAALTDELGGAIDFTCPECPGGDVTVTFTTDVSDGA